MPYFRLKGRCALLQIKGKMCPSSDYREGALLQITGKVPYFRLQGRCALLQIKGKVPYFRLKGRCALLQITGKVPYFRLQGRCALLQIKSTNQFRKKPQLKIVQLDIFNIFFFIEMFK